MSATSDIERIEFALDAILTEMIEKRKTGPTPAGERSSIGRPQLESLPTHEESEVNHIIREPLEGAYRLALRKLGQRLYDVTKNTELMREILERVADRDSANYGRRAVILGSAWNGVGSVIDRWFS
jgi:hypothetical protein